MCVCACTLGIVDKRFSRIFVTMESSRLVWIVTLEQRFILKDGSQGTSLSTKVPSPSLLYSIWTRENNTVFYSFTSFLVPLYYLSVSGSNFSDQFMPCYTQIFFFVFVTIIF